MVRSFWIAFALAALGCGKDDETTPNVDLPPTSCMAGEWLRDDGACIAAGVPPDMPCAPAEWLSDDGVCVPAGVPPDGCGQGFAHDGDHGCTPILPAAPCGPGLMAVVGETTCRAVAPCAAGAWGDIPVEPDTEYVDASYAGMDSDGSALKPWTTVQAGVDAALPGAIVAIAEGSYVEDVSVSGKPARLWGVCPALVEIVGVGAEVAAITVLTNATGTEVRGLSIRGDAIGIGVSGSVDVLAERVWVHQTGGLGVTIESAFGSTSLTLRSSLVEESPGTAVYVYGADAIVEASVLRDTLYGRGVGAEVNRTSGMPSTVLVRSSLIERTHDVGVFSAGAQITLEESVIQDTQTDAQGSFGRGVNARMDDTTLAPSTLLVRSSVIARNPEVGVFVEGSEATVETSVIRETQGLHAWGMGVQTDPATGAPSTLVLRSSLVAQSADLGVFVYGSAATLEASVVRDGKPQGQGLPARGLGAQIDRTTGARSTLLVRSSLIEDNGELGVLVEGSDARLETSLFRGADLVLPGSFGRAVSAQFDALTGARATLSVVSSVFDQNQEIGIFLAGADATVETSIVRATQLDAGGLGGRGVQAQAHPANGGVPSTLVLQSSLIEQSYEAAVAILSSSATIDACVLRDTQPSPGWGAGEGVMVAFNPGAASATITRTRIDRSALAAVAAWGAHAVIGGSAFSCQAYDLNTEPYLGNAAKLEDLGGNACGCPEPEAPCKSVSAGLEPPQPAEPIQE